MNLKTVAKRVVQKSIRSAVCLDDTYASAYAEQDPSLEFDEPRKLHRSFREEGHCDLDIYQFKNIEESWEKDKGFMLNNKDLFVLDWELDPAAGFSSTVKILKDIIDSKKIPFVLIYTNREDLHSIGKTLIRNFHKCTEINFKEFCQKVNTKFSHVSDDEESIDAELFFSENIELFYEYVFYSSTTRKREIRSNIIKKLISSFSIKSSNHTSTETMLRKLIKTEVSEEDEIEALAFNVLSENMNDVPYKISRIDVDKHAYLINGTTVIIYQKQKQSEGIKPENLFTEFATTIINNPHNFISLLALEFKDRLREDFSIIGSKFSGTNERAFLYHASNYRNKEEKFDLKNIYDFILKSWIGELHYHKMGSESEVLECLEERYSSITPAIPKDIGEEDKALQQELVKYASFISHSDGKRRLDQTLRFGDVFTHEKNPNEYFICITPLCDCLRPNKINNNFYFVKGIKCDDYEALQEAESGHFSFLDLDSNPISIKWKTKPFTAYILENDINNMFFDYCGKSVKLRHVSLLKENYTQRIANQSYGYGYRVGVDLPHIKRQESDKDD